MFGRLEAEEKDIRGDLLVHVKDEPYDVVDGVKDGGAVQGF